MRRRPSTPYLDGLLDRGAERIHVPKRVALAMVLWPDVVDRPRSGRRQVELVTTYAALMSSILFSPDGLTFAGVRRIASTLDFGSSGHTWPRRREELIASGWLTVVREGDKPSRRPWLMVSSVPASSLLAMPNSLFEYLHAVEEHLAEYELPVDVVHGTDAEKFLGPAERASLASSPIALRRDTDYRARPRLGIALEPSIYRGEPRSASRWGANDTETREPLNIETPTAVGDSEHVRWLVGPREGLVVEEESSRAKQLIAEGRAERVEPRREIA